MTKGDEGMEEILSKLAKTVIKRTNISVTANEFVERVRTFVPSTLPLQASESSASSPRELPDRRGD